MTKQEFDLWWNHAAAQDRLDVLAEKVMGWRRLDNNPNSWPPKNKVVVGCSLWARDLNDPRHRDYRPYYIEKEETISAWEPWNIDHAWPLLGALKRRGLSVFADFCDALGEWCEASCDDGHITLMNVLGNLTSELICRAACRAVLCETCLDRPGGHRYHEPQLP